MASVARKPAQTWESAAPAPPEALALRAQAGSKAAYSELVERFQGRLYNFLLRRVGSATDAEDLAQEAFVRAWERIGTYKPDWRFSTWLFTIAGRLAVSRARRPVLKTQAMPEEPAMRSSESVREPDDEGIARSRVWSLVGELLGPEQQTAIWLRYVEGMAVTDIARVLSRTQVSVRVMLFRARGVLATALAEEPGVVQEIAPMVQVPRPAAREGARC